MDSQSIQMYSTSTKGENSMKNDALIMEDGKLCAQVQEINKRLTKIEENFKKWSPVINLLSGEHLLESDGLPLTTQNHSISGAGKTALSVMDYDLITSKPRNKSIADQLWDCIAVVKRYNFAMLQCLLIFVALATLLTVGGLKFVDAHASVRDPYKPYKVDGRDEYYRNEKLTYKLPIHYFWFELGVNETDFYSVYQWKFNETCDSTLRDCLDWYINDFLNSTDETSSDDDDYDYDSNDYSTFDDYTSNISYNDSSSTQFYVENEMHQIVSEVIEVSAGAMTNKYPLSAHCYMTTSSDGTVTTETVGLQNFTMNLDDIGVNLQNSSGVTNILGMLIRLEFADFSGYMSGKVMCDINLDMERLDFALSGFSTFDILFMVSREEFSSATTGITEYIRSTKKVWRRQNDMIDQIYSYAFEENTYDGVSDFSAEVHLVDESVDHGAMLNIEVYPYPTVMHFVSFDRYSYLDWLADIGGFYTLIAGFFFILASRLIKLANRRRNFYSRHGILPAFSLSHRNAEELSVLRSLVLAALKITEQDYFSNNMAKRMTNIEL